MAPTSRDLVVAGLAALGLTGAAFMVPKKTPSAPVATMTATAVEAPPAPARAAAFAVERQLGHAAFDEGRRIAALHHYERALLLDARAADFEMIDNLIDCYGSRRAQPEAAALIARFKLLAAERSLERLSKSSAHGIRWGAIYTRARLTQVHKGDYIDALALDLDTGDCPTRRHAADRLAHLGGRHATHVLRVASAWAAAHPSRDRACFDGQIASAKKIPSRL